MNLLLIVFCFADIFVQLTLLNFLWRMFRELGWIKRKNNDNNQTKPIRRNSLLFFQTLSILIVFSLALIVTYDAGAPFLKDLLLMFALYLALPIHGGIVLLTAIVHSIYIRKK